MCQANIDLAGPFVCCKSFRNKRISFTCVIWIRHIWSTNVTTKCFEVFRWLSLSLSLSLFRYLCLFVSFWYVLLCTHMYLSMCLSVCLSRPVALYLSMCFVASLHVSCLWFSLVFSKSLSVSPSLCASVSASLSFRRFTCPGRCLCCFCVALSLCLSFSRCLCLSFWYSSFLWTFAFQSLVSLYQSMPMLVWLS